MLIHSDQYHINAYTLSIISKLIHSVSYQCLYTQYHINAYTLSIISMLIHSVSYQCLYTQYHINVYTLSIISMLIHSVSYQWNSNSNHCWCLSTHLNLECTITWGYGSPAKKASFDFHTENPTGLHKAVKKLNTLSHHKYSQ